MLSPAQETQSQRNWRACLVLPCHATDTNITQSGESADMPPPLLENDALAGRRPRRDVANDTAKTRLVPHALRPLEGAPGYFLGERFAAGGMGSVHFGLKCGALGFQRVVAIKQMHSHLLETPEFVARFKHEIRVVSRLSHPNIVDTLDVIEAQGELNLVMEYVDGDTLCDLLKAARESGLQLGISAAVGILSQALHGLHAAHEASDDNGNGLNLVHRDVSPQNIMVGKDGVVKILDFGVAKARSEQPVTYVGEILGKAAYMSPEQSLARPLDRRSDIFAAGIVLWEALSGHRLFRAPDSSGLGPLLKVLHTRPRPPSELREGISPELDAIVLRALAHDPSRRFGSARDFALALEQAVPGASASVVANALSAICGERSIRRTQLLTALRASLASDTSPASDLAGCGTAAPDSKPVVPDVPGRAEEATPTTLEGRDDPELRASDLKGTFVLSAGTPPLRPERRSLGWALVPLAALSVLALFAARSAVEPDPGGPSNIPTKSLAGGLIEPKRALVASRSAALPPAQPTPLAEVAPVPRSSDASSPPRSRALATKSTRTQRTRTSATPSVRAEVNCASPSYVDAEGIRHFKSECL
jgi:eukaryotic-like serine/threonine-protein kinase